MIVRKWNRIRAEIIQYFVYFLYPALFFLFNMFLNNICEVFSMDEKEHVRSASFSDLYHCQNDVGISKIEYLLAIFYQKYTGRNEEITHRTIRFKRH